MSKVVSLCGVERGDFVYYVAALLSMSGKAVLVIDNSYSNDIYGSVSDFDATSEKDYIIKQNITYIKNVSYNSDVEEIYDYILIWHGMNVQESELMQSEEIYLMPDYTPMTLLALKDKITDRENLKAVLMRDSVLSNKITEKSVAEYLEIPDQKIIGIMVYDAKDYENYLAFLYNGKQKFTSLTPNYNDCIKYVVKEILGTDKKTVDKLFAKSKKAKTF